MAKKKHNFHCQHCGSECQIYKKGRGHRVLVCPHCGVIATNPTLAGSLLKFGAGFIPGVGPIASGLIGAVQDAKASKQAQQPAQTQTTHTTGNHLTSFEKALLLERLEH